MSHRRSRDLEMFFLRLLLLTLTERTSRLLEMERRSELSGYPALRRSSELANDSQLARRTGGDAGVLGGVSQRCVSASPAVRRSLKRHQQYTVKRWPPDGLSNNVQSDTDRQAIPIGRNSDQQYTSRGKKVLEPYIGYHTVYCLSGESSVTPVLFDVLVLNTLLSRGAYLQQETDDGSMRAGDASDQFMALSANNQM